MKMEDLLEKFSSGDLERLAIDTDSFIRSLEYDYQTFNGNDYECSTFKLPAEINKINVITDQIDGKNYYSPLNPSIVKIDNIFYISVRAVNYRNHLANNYQILGKNVVNKNYLLLFNNQFEQILQMEIIDNSMKVDGPIVSEGLEDIRLFVNHDGDLSILANASDITEAKIPTMIKAKLNPETGHTSNFSIYQAQEPERNWLPFVHDGISKAIYSYHPFKIKDITNDENIMNDIVSINYNQIFNNFKGSSGPIKFDYLGQSGYLILIHQCFPVKHGLNYFQRFIWLNSKFEICCLSPLFYLLEESVEFISGMCLDNNRLILTFGLNDREAYMAELSVRVIDSILYPFHLIENTKTPNNTHSLKNKSKGKEATEVEENEIEENTEKTDLAIPFVDKLSGMNFMAKYNPATEHILNHGIAEYSLINWLKEIVPKETNFIDVGTHIGTYSIILSECFNNVYSFEPQRDIYNCLCGSIALNGIRNIRTYNTALSDSNVDSMMYHISEDGNESTLREPMEYLTKSVVKCKTLDDYNFKNIGFIRIDVEGWEENVLKGGLNTLMLNNYPKLLFKSNVDSKSLSEFITSIGYKIINISGYNNVFLAEHKD